MRTILYVKKETKANTEYRLMSRQDLDWLFTKMNQILSVCQYKQTGSVCDRGSSLPLNERFTMKYPTLPRMSTGIQNSIQSFCEGIISNFKNQSKTGLQRDLSNKQCDGLQIVFQVANQLIADFDEVEFVEADALPKLKAPTDRMSTFFDFSKTAYCGTRSSIAVEDC